MEVVESKDTTQSSQDNLIKEGDQVVFHRDGWSRVMQIRKNRQIYLEKTKLDVDTLIGQPYGSMFQLDRRKLVKVDTSSTSAVLSIGAEPGTDNRNLLDQDSNQKMSREDIMKMKEEGVTGQEIIEELVENSETFKTKTEFSQAKYIKKKKKKHIPIFTVLKPTPRLVLDIFSNDPAKICYLRADTLSQLLSYSNVMYGSRVAVVDTCQGLVLSCLLQRVGDSGKVIQLIPNHTQSISRQVMDYLGFSKSEENVYTFPMDELDLLTSNGTTQACSAIDTDASNGTTQACLTIDTDASNGTTHSCSAMDTNAASVAEKSESKDDQISCANNSCEKEEVNDIETEIKKTEAAEGTDNVAGNKRSNNTSELGPLREAQRQKRAARKKEAGEIIKGKELDSLVLACKYNPTPIVMKMLQFLRPSVSVAIFCQHLEPLVECCTQLKEGRTGLQRKLSETWLRDYQILPQRTHPNINMSGTGGYLFTFITSQS